METRIVTYTAIDTNETTTEFQELYSAEEFRDIRKAKLQELAESAKQANEKMIADNIPEPVRTVAMWQLLSQAERVLRTPRQDMPKSRTVLF